MRCIYYIICIFLMEHIIAKMTNEGPRGPNGETRK